MIVRLSSRHHLAFVEKNPMSRKKKSKEQGQTPAGHLSALGENVRMKEGFAEKMLLVHGFSETRFSRQDVVRR